MGRGSRHERSHIAPVAACISSTSGSASVCPQPSRPLCSHSSITIRSPARAPISNRCRHIAQSRGLQLSFERLHRGYTDYAVLSQKDPCRLIFSDGKGWSIVRRRSNI